MKTRFELNVDLETLNEKKLFQEDYDIELENWERDYLCSKEFDELYKIEVEYLPYDVYDDECEYEYDKYLFETDHENYILAELTELYEQQIPEEYYLKRLDQLHAIRSDDPDDIFFCYSSLCGYYVSTLNIFINYDYDNNFTYYRSRWTIQDLKDYLYEREHDEEYINQLRYERLKEILNSEFNYDYETLNEQQLFREAYDIEIYKLERENLLS